MLGRVCILLISGKLCEWRLQQSGAVNVLWAHVVKPVAPCYFDFYCQPLAPCYFDFYCDSQYDNHCYWPCFLLLLLPLLSVATTAITLPHCSCCCTDFAAAATFSLCCCRLWYHALIAGSMQYTPRSSQLHAQTATQMQTASYQFVVCCVLCAMCHVHLDAVAC